MGAKHQKLPFAPLDVLLDPGTEASQVRASEILGVPRATIANWRKRGIPLKRADEMAIRIGCHPAEVWGLEVWAEGLDVWAECESSSL